MRKFKVLMSTYLALSMVLSVGYMVPAQDNKIKTTDSVVQKSNNIQNNSKRLTFDEAEILFEDIKTKLENKYQGVYTCDNFQASFADVESKDELI